MRNNRKPTKAPLCLQQKGATRLFIGHHEDGHQASINTASNPKWRAWPALLSPRLRLLAYSICHHKFFNTLLSFNNIPYIYYTPFFGKDERRLACQIFQ